MLLQPGENHHEFFALSGEAVNCKKVRSGGKFAIALGWKRWKTGFF